MQATTCAIVPAFNEESTVGAVVTALLLEHIADSVIVVDDGSSDHTGVSASSAGAVVYRRPKQGGKGAAVSDGLRQAWELTPTYILFVDADIGEYASQMEPVLRAVKSRQADMAVARFAQSSGGGVGAVMKLARAGIRELGGTEMRSPLSGQRAMCADKLRDVVNRCGLEKGYGLEVGLTIDWLRAGYSLIEVPTSMVHRGMGRGPAGFAHRGTQLAQVSLALAKRGRGAATF